MPPALEEDKKNRVWRLWLSGETRKNIAEICEIGAGSVTNIINEKTKCLDGSEYGAIRDLAVQLKKEGMSFAELASFYRRHNYIKQQDANEEEIEILIGNLLDNTKFIPIEKSVNMVNQLYELSKSESIPPTEVPVYVNQKIKEKQELEEEIQKTRMILDQENIDIQNLDEYKKLKKELESCRLSIGAPRRLISLLRTVDEMEYNPQKIVSSLARIKSLKGTERSLKNNCKMWESRMARYAKLVPLCERVVSMGIGIPLLLALETAVIKKIEVDCVSPSSAPFRVMQDLEAHNRHGGMNKQLNDTIRKVQMVNLVSARQNAAVIALAKLQYYGITDNQILNLCKIIESNGYNLAGARSTNPHSFSTF